jgi:hypothetical protein
LSAFPAAVDAIFADSNIGEDAIWRTGGIGAGIPVRVIRKSPDKILGFGDSRAVMPSVLIDVRTAEVAEPAVGDTIEIASAVFDIIADPTGDTLRLAWTCEVSLRP